MCSLWTVHRDEDAHGASQDSGVHCGGYSIMANEFINKKELESIKDKYRGSKIASIKKIEGKIHVTLAPRKGSKACFSRTTSMI